MRERENHSKSPTTGCVAKCMKVRISLILTLQTVIHILSCSQGISVCFSFPPQREVCVFLIFFKIKRRKGRNMKGVCNMVMFEQ